MMTDTLHQAPQDHAPAHPLSNLRTLAHEVSARAGEAERAGTMPEDLVDRFRRVGLFRALQPRALGGLELEPQVFVELIEELSRADGSAGWTATIGAGGSAFAAWLEPAVARQTFGPDADFTSATVFAPLGRLVLIDSRAYSVSGRWPFASGCRHAEWFVMGGFVFDGDAPRMVPDRGPDWRLAWFPAAAGEVVEHWDVMGLRATGSNDVVAESVPVPDELTTSPFFEPARHDGPLWRLPFFTLAGIALVGVPLGIARRALDELAALAPTKVRAGTMEPIAHDAAALVAMARAEAHLRAARAFVFDEIGSLWVTAINGDVPSITEQASIRLAALEVMHAALVAVDTALELCGASAIRSDHVLQRCFPRYPHRQPARVLRECRAPTLVPGALGDGGVLGHAVTLPPPRRQESHAGRDPRRLVRHPADAALLREARRP
jgi:indole-3-acetate monooxygenase